MHDHRLGEVTLDSCSLDEFEQRTGFRPPLFTDVLAWAEAGSDLTSSSRRTVTPSRSRRC